MMIAIPNIEKPKSCGLCQLCLNDSRIANGYCMFFHRTVNTMELDKDCSLIEIIPCEECRYSKIYALQSDAPMKRWCHKDHFPKEVKDYYFCGDGGRK